jgi:hypothetical protein
MRYRSSASATNLKWEISRIMSPIISRCDISANRSVPPVVGQFESSPCLAVGVFNLALLSYGRTRIQFVSQLQEPQRGNR